MKKIRCGYCGQLNHTDALACRCCGGRLVDEDIVVTEVFPTKPAVKILPYVDLEKDCDLKWVQVWNTSVWSVNYVFSFKLKATGEEYRKMVEVNTTRLIRTKNSYEMVEEVYRQLMSGLGVRAEKFCEWVDRLKPDFDMYSMNRMIVV